MIAPSCQERFLRSVKTPAGSLTQRGGGEEITHEEGGEKQTKADGADCILQSDRYTVK
jgi:hypothetical protein